MHLKPSGFKWLTCTILMFASNAAAAGDKEANTDNFGSDENSPELLDAYKDSYITKDAAQKFLAKMKNYRNMHTDTEFQHFVDEIAFEPVAKSNDDQSFYDKKYFDYLPSDETKQQALADDELPPPLAQRENHRRLKRQTVDYFFFTDHDADRWYPPPRLNNAYLPASGAKPPPQSIGNRGFFDLNDNFIFDYVYEPARSGYFGPAPLPSRPILGFNNNRPSVSGFNPTSTTTTKRPWTPPPKAEEPQPVSPVSNNLSPSQSGTTEAPAIFHSSDYDYDLDDDVASRFGIIDEPDKCSWAVSNCCAAVSYQKRERCFQIFRCKLPVEQGCSPPNMLKAAHKTFDFLNSARKK